MKNIKTFVVFLFFNAFALSVVNAQDKKPEEVKKMVEAQNFVFKAQQVLPQSGRSRQLTSEYDLSIAPDTIVSFLPYFGRAYSAPINSSDAGIKFTSTKFDYKRKAKGQGWEITIRPTDASDVQQLYLNVYDNGRARLQVVSINRQPISFDGYVIEGRERNKKAF
ncbi:MAG TPA: DUF4251 domain-containing protein [Chitinophagaceae bacterium]|nr:DUF4251 domain-containing protein [Chitinophagaceae bacterium]